MGTLIKTQANIKNTMKEPVNSASEVILDFPEGWMVKIRGIGVINIKKK